MSTARPVVSIYHESGKKKTTTRVPTVFQAPIRKDLVRDVHTNMSKNRRQAQGVKDEAGYGYAAASWGTGRAVSRIPRVPGGGTHRSGQGAFGNMCRGGGMFNPTKTWRRWHRLTNVTKKRHAVAVAIAASAVPSIVMARGHKIDRVPELPLVVSEKTQSLQKTRDAMAFLAAVGASDEVAKVKDSKKIRCGAGKMRNRRYVMRRGPLIVYAEDEGITKACRNLPGVEICHVDRLNLLQLAPGGTVGRFIIWTAPAFERLQGLFGSYQTGSIAKNGYRLPRSLMANPDISKIINSDEIQSVLRPARTMVQRIGQKRNPLKNKQAMAKINPGALKKLKLRGAACVKGSAVHKQVRRAVEKRAKKAKGAKKIGKEYFKALTEAYKPKAKETSE